MVVPTNSVKASLRPVFDKAHAIITHRGTLEDGPEFYRNFRDNRSEFTKCVMTP